MADNRLLRNCSNGPRSYQADKKKPAVMLFPGQAVPLTKAVEECDDVVRQLRAKHFRIETPTKSTKPTAKEGG